jgi:hypothetical protein
MKKLFCQIEERIEVTIPAWKSISLQIPKQQNTKRPPFQAAFFLFSADEMRVLSIAQTLCPSLHTS